MHFYCRPDSRESGMQSRRTLFCARVAAGCKEIRSRRTRGDNNDNNSKDGSYNGGREGSPPVWYPRRWVSREKGSSRDNSSERSRGSRRVRLLFVRPKRFSPGWGSEKTVCFFRVIFSFPEGKYYFAWEFLPRPYLCCLASERTRRAYTHARTPALSSPRSYFPMGRRKQPPPPPRGANTRGDRRAESPADLRRPPLKTAQVRTEFSMCGRKYAEPRGGIDSLCADSPLACFGRTRRFTCTSFTSMHRKQLTRQFCHVTSRGTGQFRFEISARRERRPG